MAPDLPPPVRGGVDLGNLLSAPLKGRRPVKPWHERQGFFVQGGTYVLRRFDPISLSHACWDKLAFCDLTQRLLIRCGKLPEVDPRAILDGLRTSLEALPEPGKTLQDRIAHLRKQEVQAVFAEWWKSEGPVASTLKVFEILHAAELRKRSAERSIALALDEIARPRPGLSAANVETIRAQAIECHAVTLSLSALDASTLHDTVRKLTNQFVEKINTELLKESLRKNPWQNDGVRRFEEVIDDYVKHARTEADMSAGIMTGQKMESFATRLAEKRRIAILKARYLIDDALASTLLRRAEGMGQRKPYLALAPTFREAQAFNELVGGDDAVRFHSQVADHAVAQLPQSRQLTGPALQAARRIIAAAARIMGPSVQAEEQQLIKENRAKPEPDQVEALQRFRNGIVEVRMGALLDFANALNAVVETASSVPTPTEASEGAILADLSRAAAAWQDAKSLGVTDQDCTAWLMEAVTLAITSAGASAITTRAGRLDAIFSTAAYLKLLPSDLQKVIRAHD